ncbi:MAG TPA: cytochrome c biogenesis protein CcdA [Patescibacteria group bacterium]|nr:cytochrome c biogenesis protein CcdA [Patescibacteria group bacterium]
MKSIVFSILALLFSMQTVGAQQFGTPQPQKVKLRTTYSPREITVEAGKDTSFSITYKTTEGYYFYGPESPKGGGKKLEFELDSKLLKLGKLRGPKPKIKYDSTFEVYIHEYRGSVKFDVPLRINPATKPGQYQTKIISWAQVCDTMSCVDIPDTLAFTLNVLAATDTSGLGANDSAFAVPAVTNNQRNDLPPAATVTESQQEIENKKKEGVLSFLWFAMTAGALSLLTPCVFPMIPITVSFFTKRTEKSKGKGLRDSIVYALGIITTFTAIGFVVSLIFGSTGISDFATNPWVNIFIALIFIIFALNLFGAFEIQVPTSVLNKLNRSSQGDGVGSVLLMGLTFSLTSFTCTVPFVGSALISASSGEWFYPIIGMLGFSAVFAAPFFLLALFPSAMSKLPKSGGWMNNVKVVMGFMEIAAAIKFISNVDLVWGWGVLPRELFLAIWIGCATLATLYILGLFKFSLDSNVDRVGGGRAVFAIVFASITFYLLSGLYGKPLGELDAFLPPPDYEQHTGTQTGGTPVQTASMGGGGSLKTNAEASEENWFSDYKTALAESKKTGKPLFIDFTGFTCTNCRWMERNMFPKQQVAGLMDQMIKVRLYTDRREEPYLSNKSMQQSRFGSIELPLYVVMKPNEEVVGTKAFTRNEAEFAEFLKKGVN